MAENTMEPTATPLDIPEENNVLDLHAVADPEPAGIPEKIVVGDGTESVPVENENGKVLGTFTFRPTDMGIVGRWNAMVDDFDSITKPLEALDEDNISTDEAFKALDEAKERLCNALDRAFDGNVSDAFFSGVHPFALVGGRFYCENVMDAVAAYMSARFNDEFKRVNDRQMQKAAGYAHRVRTGRHAKGRA